MIDNVICNYKKTTGKKDVDKQFLLKNKNKKPTRLSGFRGTSSPDTSGEPGTQTFLFF